MKPFKRNLSVSIAPLNSCYLPFLHIDSYKFYTIEICDFFKLHKKLRNLQLCNTVLQKSSLKNEIMKEVDLEGGAMK